MTFNEIKIEFAMKMVIMDAMEKGHTDSEGLIEYMKSETFEKAVASYSKMFQDKFSV